MCFLLRKFYLAWRKEKGPFAVIKQIEIIRLPLWRCNDWTENLCIYMKTKSCTSPKTFFILKQQSYSKHCRRCVLFECSLVIPVQHSSNVLRSVSGTSDPQSCVISYTQYKSLYSPCMCWPNALDSGETRRSSCHAINCWNWFHDFPHFPFCCDEHSRTDVALLFSWQ